MADVVGLSTQGLHWRKGLLLFESVPSKILTVIAKLKLAK